MKLTVLIAALLAGAPGASWLGPKPPAHPARVATLAPSLTELVQALSAGNRLVGVSKFDDDPAVAKLPRLGGLMDPSPEAILAVKPELLVVQPSPTIQPLLERVAELGVPVLELPMSNVAEVETAERELGAALGEKQKGDALAAELESSLAAARAKIPAGKRQRALIVYGWSPLVVAGPGSFADELLRAAGGENAAAGAKGAYVTYSAELAADAHPDLLVDLAFTMGDQMPAAFQQLPGLARARVVHPKTQALLHPGPKLVEGLLELQQALNEPKPDGH
ncbi:MAG: ABC transporter substrate-binding protein [Deltaproteobacteria bacterium]|nr:ABC transporter substrate-binding protein [Deltaproteobacteria bacterium]